MNLNQTTTSSESEVDKFCTVCKRKGHYAREHADWVKIGMKVGETHQDKIKVEDRFKEKFPSFCESEETGHNLKELVIGEYDEDYWRIILLENFLDKKIVKEVIDKVLCCSTHNLADGNQCTDDECINCTKNKELKKDLEIR